MENFNQNPMGEKSWWNDTLTKGGRITIIVLGALALFGVLYLLRDFIPGIKVEESKAGTELNIDGTVIDNQIKSDKLPLPSNNISKRVAKLPQYNLVEYTWNGNVAMLTANGGPKTTEGSLMEQYKVNLNVIRQDNFDKLQASMMSFVAEFDAGNPNPKSDMSAFGCSIMGDGAPYMITTLNKMCNEKFGEGKYHWVVKGGYGASYGEDKLIGPKSWLQPKNMIGGIIITNVGDGDWVTSLNHIFANKGIKVNPNIGTYDANAVNFVHNPDIIECANELVASQINNKVYDLKEIKDGKLTGKTVSRKLDAVATWLPGDKIVFDKLPDYVTISSTKEFPNQMITTLIVLKEWSDKNPQVVTNILSATYIASNQIKLYDEWLVKGSQCVAKTYDFQNPKYWYEMFKGKKIAGSDNIAGGTRVLNYADALQYYGLGDDGIDRYKSVYEQVATYLKDLNPNGFNESAGKVVSYEDAVDLSSLRAIKGIDTGIVEQQDYSKEATEIVASGEWRINFNTGSSEILSSSNKELNELYNLLIQAENSKISVEGHTDNTGNYSLNKTLSEQRANAVVDYLVNRGINYNRIQSIVGYGSDKPISNNTTAEGRYKNRRVQIVLLK